MLILAPNASKVVTPRCIIATLSSNFDLRLWSATRNSLKGEWKKVLDVTPYLLDKLKALSDDSQIIWTLHAQAISAFPLSYTLHLEFTSSQVYVGLEPILASHLLPRAVDHSWQWAIELAA
jgi:hypothetical protein